MGLKALITQLFWTAVRRDKLAAMVDEQAIQLLKKLEREAAYQQARDLQRAAQTEGDHQTARFFARVAICIADLTGRQIGPVDRSDPSPRYGRARRQINGQRTRRV